MKSETGSRKSENISRCDAATLREKNCDFATLHEKTKQEGQKKSHAATLRRCVKKNCDFASLREKKPSPPANQIKP